MTQKIKILFLLICLFVGPLTPAQAQWYRRVFKNPKRASVVEKISRAISRRSAAKRMETELRKSMLQVHDYRPREGFVESVPASAFVVETSVNGQRKLFGVTSAHYGFQNPALVHPTSHKPITVPYKAQGTIMYTDVALFDIPEELEPHIKPLPLASSGVEGKETLHSLGIFGQKGYQHQHNRIVKKITISRVITTYEFDRWRTYSGSCGGPVLNAKNEVVGVQCGVNRAKNQSFVVPVAHIYELIHAYYHQGGTPKPVLLNGKELYRIHINEAIVYIQLVRNGQIIKAFAPHSLRTDLNYAHLERIIDTSNVDELVLVIERKPFSMLQADQTVHSYKVSYELQTGNVQVDEVDSW